MEWNLGFGVEGNILFGGLLCDGRDVGMRFGGLGVGVLRGDSGNCK